MALLNFLYNPGMDLNEVGNSIIYNNALPTLFYIVSSWTFTMELFYQTQAYTILDESAAARYILWTKSLLIGADSLLYSICFDTTTSINSNLSHISTQKKLLTFTPELALLLRSLFTLMSQELNYVSLMSEFHSTLREQITPIYFFLFSGFCISYLLFLAVYYLFKITPYVFGFESDYDNYANSAYYLVESEKELGSVDDMLVGISIFLCIYGWFFGLQVFLLILNNYDFYVVYCGFPLLLLGILGMPLNMTYDYGVAFVTFLRGASNTTVIFLEWLFDILATGIMFIRLSVQNVRFLLMFFAFLEIYEFFLELNLISEHAFTTVSSLYNFSGNGTALFSQYSFNVLLYVPKVFLYYLYNIGHLIYTVISHFFAYLVLVFWFFSFLYTSFFNERLEKHFFNKVS